METHGKSSSDADSASSSHSSVAPGKTAHKRAKGKSRVWEKVAWFTRRSRSKDHAVGGATAASSESDLSGIPLDNMEFDISPSSSCFDAAGLHQWAPPSWVGSSSSTDSGETFQEEFQDGYRVKRSRLYPNSEVIEQHCLKPSVARALFHQMEAASCRGGKGTKYSWQVKKKKSHSIPWHSNYADNSTGQYFRSHWIHWCKITFHHSQWMIMYYQQMVSESILINRKWEKWRLKCNLHVLILKKASKNLMSFPINFLLCSSKIYYRPPGSDGR